MPTHHPAARDPIASTQAEMPALASMTRLLASDQAGELALIGPSGERISLPPSVPMVLRRAVEAFARDRAVTMDSMGKELTADAAATLLGLPRQDFVKMIDDGAMPSRVLFGLQQVLFEDVMVLKAKIDAGRRRILDEMASERQELQHIVDAQEPRPFAVDHERAVG